MTTSASACLWADTGRKQPGEHMKKLLVILGVAIVALAAGLSVAACGGTTTIIKEAPATPEPSPTARPSPPSPAPSPTQAQTPGQAAPQGTTSPPVEQAAPQGTSSPPAQPTLDGAVEPSAIGVGANNEIDDISWQTWNSNEAVGTGQQLIDDCNPDCADAPTSYETVTITLTGVEGNAYTLISEVDQNGNPFNAEYGPSVSSFVQSVS
jgi:hypothetical protein